MDDDHPVSLEFAGVRYERDGRTILDGISWRVSEGQRWVVLGPNGSGKTTLMKLAGAQVHPTSGSLCVLGQTLGHTDVRRLRRRIGVVSGSVTRELRKDILAGDVVLSGRRSALETWWDEYTAEDRRAAAQRLHENGIDGLAAKGFDVISEGERQRVLLARALVNDPGVLLLDEPFAGLDLGARERLLLRLTQMFADEATPTVVLVTHHTEEIPPNTTHCLLLRDGKVVASGEIASALTNQSVSETFGLPVNVEKGHDGRWSCRVLPS